MTLNFYNSQASNYDALIGVQKKREDRLVTHKLNRRRVSDDLSRVPPSARNITLFDLKNQQLDPEVHKFHQFDSEKINIFFS